MEQYISKDALVAEIKKRIADIVDECSKSKHPQFTLYGKINALENLLPFIDTIEVKEVDLEKGSLTWEDIPELLSISEQLKTRWWFRDRTKEIGTQVFWEEVLKRFKAQKGE